MTARQAGQLCEQAVCEDLARHGIEILARNFTCREGEIDIIARDGEYTVFVEVKARQSSRFGTPSEAVTPQKRRKLLLAAQKYLLQQETGPAVRFDVAQVYYTPDGEQLLNICIEYLTDAFGEDY